MRPEISFNYGEKQCVFSSEYSAIYDLGGGISVSTEVKKYPKYDAVEWLSYFENASQENSNIISNILDCDTVLPFVIPEPPAAGHMPKENDPCIITMKGMVEGVLYSDDDKISATEFEFNREYLDKVPQKTKRFANTRGRSSDGIMPFFDVTANGCGYIVAIGWSGDWKAEFSRREDGISMKSGLKETNFYLKPGEKVRTSSTLVMKYGADEDKHNKFRRLIKDHFSHKSCTAAERDGLMAFELWGGLSSAEMKRRIGQLAECGETFEDLWIDAGWYGNCTKCDDTFSGDWAQHTGDWNVNTRAHPEELRDVAECIRGAGMQPMLWFEPERAVAGTKIATEHPEWFLHLSHSQFKLLDYSNEEAWNYIHELLRGYIKDLGLHCYRQDFNIPPDGFFKQYDEPTRRGISEIKHIMGMYRLWDALLEEFPHLIIDNCASGGRRIDIETLKRSIPFFRSDYQCNFNEEPEVLQTHASNANAYFPYIGCTSKTKSDDYAIRSSYSSSWGGAFYSTIHQSMNEADLIWTKKICDEYRRIRKYFSMDFYNHGSICFDDTSWAIWQYHDASTQSGIIMAFRRKNSPFDRVTVNPCGLVAGREYWVESLDGGDSVGITDTLEIVLPKKRTSAIFEYRLK